MMTVDAQGVATLSTQNLHDILTSGNLGYIEEHTKQAMLPTCYDLDADAAANPVVVGIVNQLNDLLVELNNLDSAFHDEFDGDFCQ